MRIHTPAGGLAFKLSTFPDGQPHFKLETYEREFNEVTIETAIKSPCDLFKIGQVVQVLRGVGYSSVCLDIRYLMGARMDRAIDWAQPFTLELVARTLNSYGLNKVRILDAHSNVSTKLIRSATNLLPHKVLDQVLVSLGESAVIVCPDEGAKPRVQKLMESHGDWEFGYAGKTRDSDTGTLSGFHYGGPCEVKNKACLIVDDICDGGGTFVGLAKALRAKGARKVNLFVTHGIFSKGLKALAGIDKVYTTDSYCDYGLNRPLGPDGMCVVVPISMKEL